MFHFISQIFLSLAIVNDAVCFNSFLDSLLLVLKA